MNLIFNQSKHPFNPNSPTDIPTYIFEGTKEELKLLKERKELAFGKNIFVIDPKCIVR